MMELWSPRGVIPGGRMGADVLGSEILVYSFLFQEEFIPVPQPQAIMAGTSSRVQLEVENWFLGRLAVVGE